MLNVPLQSVSAYIYCLGYARMYGNKNSSTRNNSVEVSLRKRSNVMQPAVQIEPVGRSRINSSNINSVPYNMEAILPRTYSMQKSMKHEKTNLMSSLLSTDRLEFVTLADTTSGMYSCHNT